jgi:hypothetical protein
VTMDNLTMTYKKPVERRTDLGPDLPAIPPGSYPAVLAFVSIVDIPEHILKADAARWGTPIEEMDKQQWEWIFFIKGKKKFKAQDPEDKQVKDFSVYDRELAYWTKISLHPKSKTYKLITLFLGRDLEDGDQIHFPDFVGTPCLIQVDQYTSQRTQKVRNTITGVFLAPDEMTFDTNIPEDFDPVARRAARAESAANGTDNGNGAPHPADQMHQNQAKPVSDRVAAFQAILELKGLSTDEGKAALSAFKDAQGWPANLRLDKMDDEQATLVFNHFNSLPELDLDTDADDLPF